MGNKDKKSVWKAQQRASQSKGVGLVLALLLIAGTWVAITKLPRCWRGSGDKVKNASYVREAAHECLAFLATARTARHPNPDDLQVKRPIAVCSEQGDKWGGDYDISSGTKPITFFFVKKLKWDIQAWNRDHKLQPSYAVDVVLWPDMVYLAHKDILSAHADEWVRCRRCRSGKRLIEGGKTALDRWLAERLRR